MSTRAVQQKSEKSKSSQGGSNPSENHKHATKLNEEEAKHQKDATKRHEDGNEEKAHQSPVKAQANHSMSADNNKKTSKQNAMVNNDATDSKDEDMDGNDDMDSKNVKNKKHNGK